MKRPTEQKTNASLPMLFFKNPFLCLGLLIPLGLLLTNMPFWVGLICLLFIAWKGLIEVFSVAHVPRMVTNILSVVFLFVVFYTQDTILGYSEASLFLTLLTALKILEYQNQRDHLFVICLGFIICSAVFLFSIDIYTILPTFFAFFCLWRCLSLQLPWKDYSLLILKSLPLTLFLFVFFPRLESSRLLPGMNKKNMGSTGFSDQLSPGKVSEIVKNHDPVFQAKFLKNSNSIIAADQYWRGQVLNFSNGLTWLKNGPLKENIKNKGSSQLPFVNEVFYKVTLEPHYSHWLLTLQNTQRVEKQDVVFYGNSDNVFTSNETIDSRISYNGFLQTQPPAVKNQQNTILLQHPALSPALSQWLKPILSEKGNTKKSNRLLKLYKEQKFTYTLSPGEYLEKQALETFLLQRKRGFCEHYAAASATLLRAAGVPARVVLGFQGGKYNSIGDFWSFSNADAHAWVEFINDDQQWARLDATEVIAPERLQYGGDFFLDLPEEYIGTAKSQEIYQQKNARSHLWLNAVSLSLESLNYKINHFLMEFDLKKQQELIYSLPWSLLMILIVVGLLAIFLSLSLLRRPQKNIKWNKFYLEQLLQILNKYHSVQMTSIEGPDSWLQRIRPQVPTEVYLLLQSFIAAYISSEYKNSYSQGQQIHIMKTSLQNILKASRRSTAV